MYARKHIRSDPFHTEWIVRIACATSDEFIMRPRRGKHGALLAVFDLEVVVESRLARGLGAAERAR